MPLRPGRYAGAVANSMIGKEARVDNERIGFPSANRVTLQRAFCVFGMAAAIHVDRPSDPEILAVKSHDVVADLDFVHIQLAVEHPGGRMGNALRDRAVAVVVKRVSCSSAFLRERQAADGLVEIRHRRGIGLPDPGETGGACGSLRAQRCGGQNRAVLAL